MITKTEKDKETVERENWKEANESSCEADYLNCTYLVVSKIGYLLGVNKSHFEYGQYDMEHF